MTFNDVPSQSVESIENIQEIIVGIIAKELRIDVTQISPSTNLSKDLGADSFDALNITYKIEDAFSINIPDETISSFATIEDIIRGVREQAGRNH